MRRGAYKNLQKSAAAEKAATFLPPDVIIFFLPEDYALCIRRPQKRAGNFAARGEREDDRGIPRYREVLISTMYVHIVKCIPGGTVHPSS